MVSLKNTFLIFIVAVAGTANIYAADTGGKKDYEFIDERIVEDTVLLERKVTVATKYKNNPTMPHQGIWPSGKNITLNAKVPKGHIRVAVASAKGEIIKGFSKDDFEVVSGKDSVCIALNYKGRKDLSELTGKKIRLRIEVYNGAVYAFNIKQG